ncbi:MAG: GAF domain-containing protein [Candidatus Scalindua sp.]
MYSDSTSFPRDLSELVPPKSLSKLINQAAKELELLHSLRINLAKSTARENITICPGVWHYCGKIVKKDEKAIFCSKCDDHIVNEANRVKKPVIYNCDNGLFMFAMPFFWQDKWLGTLVGGQIIPHRSEQDRPKVYNILPSLDQSQGDIRDLLENARGYTELEIKAAVKFLFVRLWDVVEERILDWFSHRILNQEDVQTLLETSVEDVCELLGARACSIFLFDEESQRFVLRATTKSSFKKAKNHIDRTEAGYSPGQGFTGWVGKYGYPLWVSDVRKPDAVEKENDLERFGSKPKWSGGHLKETHPGHFMAVPILPHSRIGQIKSIGVLRVSGKRHGKQFSIQDKHFLERVAKSSGAVIESARETRKNAILKIGQNISSHQSTDGVLQDSVDKVTEAFNCATTQISLINQEKGTLAVEAMFRFTKEEIRSMEYSLSENGIAVASATKGEIIRESKAKSSKFYSGKYDKQIEPRLKDKGLKPGDSVLCVPLKQANRIIGAIKLIGKIDSKGFTLDDERYLQILAPVVAGAIENTKIHELTTINEMMSELIEVIDRTAASRIILKAAKKVTGNPEYGCVALVERIVNQVIVGAFEPESEKAKDCLNNGFRQGRGVIYNVIRSGKTFCGDVNGKTAQEFQFIECFPQVESELAVPLKANSHSIGAINVESTQKNAFSAEARQRLELIASNAAPLIYNKQTISALKEGAELINQPWDVGAILKKIADIVAHLMQVPIVSILEVDSTRNKLCVKHSRGFKNEELAASTFDINGSLAGRAFREGSFRSSDIQAERGVQNKDLVEKENLRSYLAVAMYDDENKPCGVIGAHTAGEDIRDFTQFDLEILRIFARYAAFALRTSQRIQEVSTLLKIGSEILSKQKSGMDMIKKVCEHCSDWLNARNCYIRLCDPAGEFLFPVVGAGQISSESTINRVTMEALLKAKKTLSKEKIPDQFEGVIHKVNQTRIKAAGAFPIVFGTEIIGCLIVESEHGNFFGKGIKQRLQDYATAAGMALVNLRAQTVVQTAAASCAHDINPPIMTLSNLMNKHRSIREELKLHIDRIRRHQSRLKSFASTAKTVNPDFSLCDIKQVIWGIIEDLLKSNVWKFEPNRIKVKVTPPEPTINTNEEFLSTALYMVLANAIRALHEDNTRKLKITINKSNDWHEIGIINSNSSIGEEMIRLVEENKSYPPEDNNGLGLWCAQNCIAILGGKFDIRNVAGGVKVKISLPILERIER